MKSLTNINLVPGGNAGWESVTWYAPSDEVSSNPSVWSDPSQILTIPAADIAVIAFAHGSRPDTQYFGLATMPVIDNDTTSRLAYFCECASMDSFTWNKNGPSITLKRSGV